MTTSGRSLEQRGVLVQPGWRYDGGPFAVLSLLVREPVFAEGARAIAELVRAL